MKEKMSSRDSLDPLKVSVDDLIRLTEQYQLAIDGSGVGLWDWRVQTGEFEYNERWAEMIGFTLDELQPVSIETWLQNAHPDDLKKANAAIEQHFLGVTEVYECEVRMKHKSGEWIWVLDRGKVVEWDTAGKPVRMVGTHLDITARKAAHAELVNNAVRYRELFNNMSSGVAVYEAVADGEDFIFVDFNQAGEKIDNVQKEDLIGKSVLQVFPGVKDFGLFDVFQRVWQTGVPEHHPISQYQDERLIGWRANFVYKLPLGEIVAVYSDITEQKQAQIALEALTLDLEDRVARRTNDLQTLVNAMAGREVRMADLKKVIRKLRAQLKAAGIEPVANDPYLEPFKDE
ncbi:MAG: PAS domain-containing protein [Chloroflexi bacterium]|jgi:PAS domain S-box-containing protein|nr:PAS domain-containing protein [Chloroflexota bacterium]